MSQNFDYDPDITAVFHARLIGKFMEIQSNFQRKKLSQGSTFLGGSFSNRECKGPNLMKKRKITIASSNIIFP